MYKESNLIFNILFTFLWCLGFGTQLFSPLVKTKDTGAGFLRLGTSIVLACLVLSFGLDYLLVPSVGLDQGISYFLLIFINLFVYKFHQDNKTSIMWGAYFMTIGLWSYLLMTTMPMGGVQKIFVLSIALFLGLSNFAMILGHYYLVVPKLSERILLRVVNLLIVISFFKFAHGLYSIINLKPFLEEGTTLGDGYLMNWVFFSMRVLWGYVAPIVLLFFTHKLCRLRSIQSATGVLYIIEFFVITGELLSLYLFYSEGLML